MTATISGDTGIDLIQDGAVATADIANGAVTGAKLSGAQTGSAPVYGCRAWCVFNGTTVGTNAPTAGGNVSTVTRNGTGDYTINFTTAMPDANYAIMGAVGAATTSTGRTLSGPANTAPTVSAVRVSTTTSANTVEDNTYVSIAIFR